MDKVWNIRSMQAEDAREMAQMEAQIFSRPWTEQNFLETYVLADTFGLVAVDSAGRIVGYCICYQSFDEGNISNVAIAPDMRRRGIADALIAEMLQEGSGRGIERFILEVRVSNAPAIRLYEKHGFVSEGIRKNFYADPAEDAKIMLRAGTKNLQ